uniref:Transmembrane protein n=1 Tax=Macrostomum lignano TaxID=282301 RepID=A0A1I8FQM4_9PLAT
TPARLGGGGHPDPGPTPAASTSLTRPRFTRPARPSCCWAACCERPAGAAPPTPCPPRFSGAARRRRERGLSRKPHRGGPAGLPAAAAAGLCGHCVRQPARPAHPHGGDRARLQLLHRPRLGLLLGHLAVVALGLSSVFSTFIFLFDVLPTLLSVIPPHRQLVSHGDHGGALVARQFNLIPPVRSRSSTTHMFQREKLELQMARAIRQAGPGRRGLEPVGLRHSVRQVRRRSAYSWLRDKILSEEGRQQQAKAQGARRGGDPPATARCAQLAIAWCVRSGHASCVLLWARELGPSSCTRTSALPAWCLS